MAQLLPEQQINTRRQNKNEAMQIVSKSFFVVVVFFVIVFGVVVLFVIVLVVDVVFIDRSTPTQSR